MRIVAGSLRGRRLLAPEGDTTRPTTDRVREALFSILGDIDDAVVLDLYAGTGALGLEALSRGARRAVFVESSSKASSVLRKNIDDLGLRDRCEVIARPVERAMAEIEKRGPFDLVLVDPPYAAWKGQAIDAMSAVVKRALSPSATVVIEHATRDGAPTIDGLHAFDQRTYGDTSLVLLDVVNHGAETSEAIG
jgi:16S rRNA (guanine966-N2)-methyltransferase